MWKHLRVKFACEDTNKRQNILSKKKFFVTSPRFFINEIYCVRL